MGLRFRNNIKARVSAALCLLMMLTALAGCGSSIILSKNLTENEIFQVGEEICTTPEMLVYLYSTCGQYEEVYGNGIWNAKVQEGTLQDQVKEAVLEKAAQIKTMYLMALTREIELDDGKKEECSKAADGYMKALGEENAEKLGITRETVEKLYQEYALAKAVYDQILVDVTPEISDDEARIITVMDIIIKKGQDTTTAQKALDKAEEARMEALDTGTDFSELAAKYSDEAEYEYSFGKGEKEASVETAAFNLSQGEISPVVEGKDAYHIIKCIETLNREMTEDNKLKIIEDRKNAVFGAEYDSFVETLARRVNKKAFEQLDLNNSDISNKPNFFSFIQG